MSTMLRISASHFVAAVIPGERAAPIIGYMSTWSSHKIAAYCRGKGWECELLHDGIAQPIKPDA